MNRNITTGYKTRWAREEMAKTMMNQGAQPAEIQSLTGLSMTWIETKMRQKGARPVQYQVET